MLVNTTAELAIANSLVSESKSINGSTPLSLNSLLKENQRYVDDMYIAAKKVDTTFKEVTVILHTDNCSCLKLLN